MKLNRLDTHDRLLHFKQDQALNIAQGAEDCLKKNPTSLKLQQYSNYIYIHGHPRTIDHGERTKLFISGLYESFDKVPSKKMLWQARLTRPKPDTNSYLFRATSNNDTLEICWLIPPRETWSQYQKGKMFESEPVLWSIDQFLNNPIILGRKREDDLSDDIAKNIYLKVAKEIDNEKRNTIK